MSSEEKISSDANNSSSSKEKKDDENNKMNTRGEPEEDRGEDQLVIDEQKKNLTVKVTKKNLSLLLI